MTSDALRLRTVELAREICTVELEACAIDDRGDRVRQQRWTWLTELGRWIQSAFVNRIPGGGKAWALFVRTTEALRREELLDDQEDARRARALAAAMELAQIVETTR